MSDESDKEEELFVNAVEKLKEGSKPGENIVVLSPQEAAVLVKGIDSLFFQRNTAHNTAVQAGEQAGMDRHAMIAMANACADMAKLNRETISFARKKK